MIKITLRSSIASSETDLWIGRHLLDGALVLQLAQEYGYRTVVIADDAVKATFGAKIAAKCNAELLSFPSGEGSKTRVTKEHLEDALLQKKYGRDTLLIAVGGGVATDLVGFLASTYLRSVPLLLVPTTLLAIVDASIGGKTGVDTPHGKNLIGSFYPAKAIVADLETLETLPEIEWRNGFAEILKSALIADASIWDLCKSQWRAPGKLEQIIEKTARVKVDAVQKDPLERGIRHTLNFGHTVAHALEAIAHYQLPHGEAVAIGLIVESYLSMRLGYLPKMDFDAIQDQVSKAGFLLKLPPNYDRKSFLEAMALDKKKAKGIIRFILIEGIGKALCFDGEYCRPIPAEHLEEMLRWMENQYRRD